ncbi:MAG: tRNA (adenosine(37)-N6)-threonylcarbamoyltransferase complex transferase subunit TsaD [Candidatus Cloacimonetes bacterium]|jgi:N6-L-threonylcarbamoyladenine synthase|nr:tRNA (adenosine(37)-N6)-threonylcarbamoyltransferase complex transferase subunit TsaD [Candidatus Cloacimonadota bacterium]MDD2210124.1 tRNA (adenosine(37)-N6)-threonylcarbamoyltransferase complex transferase subunit TsaD [Candidatus Cloacimonadota bacterium]MDD3282976.1 tRNA (adenosine(37)-N6)-threonylcarbamoyltransferase complex transferase subunit TsaD [Candidatus Cloacimonadota bacterium]MDD4687065.1 tRNA (adenosine(37)-N6)-threonylcarbamoyltransferase complex transferase subunit TsaD [Ca
MSLILAFESSCDDTSVAILDTDYKVFANLTTGQPQHLEFGGVLPELASRLHMKNIMHLCNLALKQANMELSDINAIAVSINPGLIGSLIVGLAFAKSLSWSLGVPLITVNHLLSHIFVNYIEHTLVQPPFLALVVSGGHTEIVHFSTNTQFEVIGKTLDDAAGETFDKAAKLMGLGFPGGPLIDKLAQNGNPHFVDLPSPLKQKDNYNFSYSGLKTAIRTYVLDKDDEFLKKHQTDIAASIQAAIIEPLIAKSIRKAKELKLPSILLAGGVAANSALRLEITKRAAKYGIKVFYPSLSLCMDNAAMVAAAAIPKFKAGLFSSLSVNANSLKGTRLL